MTDAAAIQASYSDFKLIKSRSSAQIVLEIPIEQAEAFLKVFGIPQPGAERPVAIALLNLSATEKPGRQDQAVPAERRRRFDELPRSQQAALMCEREDFQRWLGVPREEEDGDRCAAEIVRLDCGVASRAMLNTDETAGAKWDHMLFRFRHDTGQFAEQRG